MASGSVFSYRLEYCGRDEAWVILCDSENEVIVVQEGSKAAADRVFWALAPKGTVRARFVRHGSMRV